MTILLTLHIILATVLTASLVGLAIAAISRTQVSGLQNASLASLASTLLSGAGLVVLGASLTHVCLVATVYVVASFGVSYIYRKRLANTGQTPTARVY